MASLTVRKGDDQVITGVVTLAEDPETPADISGWTIRFTVKRRYPDTDGQAVAAKAIGTGITITDALLGQFKIQIAKTDFATIPNMERTVLHYDLQIRDSLFAVKTLGDGDFIVLGDITNNLS